MITDNDLLQFSPVLCYMNGDLLRRVLVLLGIDKLLPPLVSGKSTKYFFCKLIPDNVLYKQPTNRSIVRNGVKFRVDISDHMQWLIYFGHNIENRSTLYNLAKDKLSILDVGSNVGETALNMSKLSHPKSTVYAIEANPETFKALKLNCNLNPSLNVRQFNIGLSDQITSMVINQRSERNKGADQLKAISGNITDGLEDVIEVKPIDYLIEAKELPTDIDLIKIDVEGMELQVLKGAKALLERCSPVLFFEFSESNFKGYNYKGEDVLEYLKSFQYKFVSAQSGKAIQKANQIEQHTDLIAIK